MPNIFGAAARGALVRLTCPRCGEVQARARAKKGTKYTCRKCHHEFSDVEGAPERSRSTRGR